MRIFYPFLLSLFLFASCSNYVNQFSKFIENRYQMGTVTQIQVLAPSCQSNAVQIAINDAFLAMDNVENLASWFIKNSDVSKISRAKVGQIVDVDKLTFKMLLKAKLLSDETQGLFDITAGNIIKLWGFGPNSTNKIPSNFQINQALATCGMSKLNLLLAQNAVSQVVGGVSCDLSSLAAGMAADQAALSLANAGFSNFLVNAGGEIRTSSTGQKEWAVGIQVPSPTADEGMLLKDRLLKLKNSSISTSGSYIKFFKQGSNSFSHIVNPKTGRPMQTRTVSVTVLAPDCLSADGWSTALFCLPINAAISLAQKHAEIEYLIVEKADNNEAAFKFYASPIFTNPQD